MDKISPKKFSTMFGWWVGLGVSGKIKCAVLGRLLVGETALLMYPSGQVRPGPKSIALF